jgi:hypothetical protein
MKRIAIVIAIGLATATFAQADSLTSGGTKNAGTVFDGSRTPKGGLDERITIELPPPPSPPATHPVEPSTGTAGGYGVGTSTNTEK